jgi:hypothetical protein
LVALPQGQQVDTRLRDVRLDGSLSEDADQSAAVPSYVWDCSELVSPAVPCVVSSFLSSDVATQAGRVEFPTANLAPGPWGFSLVFEKSSQKARAMQTVLVDWDESPSGQLGLFDPVRLQIPSVGSPARASLLVNVEQPLVLFAEFVQTGLLANMSSWEWTVPSGVLDVSTATVGADGAYLFIPPQTLASGAGYDFVANATDTRGLVSSFTVRVTANDVPRTILSGGGCAFASSTPAEIVTLNTTLSVVCQGWTDDSRHYPLGYFFRMPGMPASAFHLSSSFAAGSEFEFVLPSPTTTGIVVQVSDALGTWTELTVPLPANTVVTSVFDSSVVADIVATALQVLAQLRRAVEVGQVERIDQIGQGLMWGITQPVVNGASEAELAELRGVWKETVSLLDKFVVVQPSQLWQVNEGVKLATWSRSAALLDAELQALLLSRVATVFALQSPDTAEIGRAYVSVLDNVLLAMSRHVNANISASVSQLYVAAVQELLKAQVVGGVAVPQSTVSALYPASNMTLLSRQDTFGVVFDRVRGDQSYAGPLQLSLAVGLQGRQHEVTLSAAAAEQISQQSPQRHGLVASALTYDIFEWASNPPLLLASDVLLFDIVDPAADSFIAIDQPIEIALELTQADDGNSATALVCAQWIPLFQVWNNDNCTTSNLTNNVLHCECRSTGIFAAVFAPIIPDGPPATPLLPLGPTPGFIAAWIPIAAFLILLALILLLLLFYCCYKRQALARSVPLSSTAHISSDGDALDDYSVHLNRPVRYHKPGVMPADAAVVFYEPTSSGDDDWPSSDLPDREHINGPLLPRQARAPFVGGRVALMRDGNGPVEAEGIIQASRGNQFDSMAVNDYVAADSNSADDFSVEKKRK